MKSCSCKCFGLSWLVIFLLLVLAVLPSEATEQALAIGPSFSTTSRHGKSSSLTSGFDVIYAFNPGDIPKYWFSGGLRYINDNGEKIAAPYLETGIWCLMNIGIGYSRIDGGADHSGNAIHLFLGAPVGLPVKSGGESGHAIFVEPYYRPIFPLDGDKSVMHEYGILVKYFYSTKENRNASSTLPIIPNSQKKQELPAVVAVGVRGEYWH